MTDLQAAVGKGGEAANNLSTVLNEMFWRDDAGVPVLWKMDRPAILTNTLIATVVTTMQVDSGDYSGGANVGNGRTVSDSDVATIPTLLADPAVSTEGLACS